VYWSDDASILQPKLVASKTLTSSLCCVNGNLTKNVHLCLKHQRGYCIRSVCWYGDEISHCTNGEVYVPSGTTSCSQAWIPCMYL